MVLGTIYNTIKAHVLPDFHILEANVFQLMLLLSVVRGISLNESITNVLYISYTLNILQ